MGTSRLDPSARSGDAARLRRLLLPAAGMLAAVLIGAALLLDDAPRAPDGSGGESSSEPAAPARGDRPAAPVAVVKEIEPPAPPSEPAPSGGPTADAGRGRLVLQFADEDGRPVEGIEVAVLPPDGEEGSTATSTEEGIARIDRLAPGEGYRWRVLTPGLTLDVAPPHETMRPRSPRSDGRHEIPELVTDRSGPFAIPRGGETRLAVTVYRSTGVRGRVVLRHEMAGPLQVRIQTRRDHPTTYTDDRSERYVDGPAFHVTGVRPGLRKRLVIIWEEEGNRYSVARYDFSLAEGETRDLGLIGPAHETVVRGTTAIELDGVEVEPREVLRAGGIAAALVGFRRIAEIEDTEDVILFDVFELEVGESFTLRGLPPGRWSIDLHSRFERDLRPGVGLDRDFDSHAVALPEDGERRFVITATRPAPLRIEPVYPFGQPPCPLRVVAVSEGGSVADGSILVIGDAPPETRLAATAGTWSVLLTSQRIGQEVTADLWGEETVEVGPEGATVRVELQPGRAVTGRARATTPRRGAGDRTLSFTLPRFADRPEPPRIFHARTDATGSFTLRGVPLGVTPAYVPGLRGIAVELDG